MENQSQPFTLVDILNIAVIFWFTAALAIPVVGAVISFGQRGGFFGPSWKTAWLYGLLAVFSVIFWWDKSE